MITYDVGKSPYYVQLSVEEYNSMVDSYNAVIAKKATDSYSPLYLDKITESYLTGNYGNPWKYQSNLIVH